ncbi:hypothetical protein FB45DRAFT_942966 [Roridomyces roridus]|uniref:Uncharacterized protein n=1 Tax=Roridomyces roridus TaxID=1738132 RepID=A0AAD7B537_9AGAR|nr:hypothetical protein FB45DRAFT_942966 [Roridomyces roridus]
MSQSFEMVAKYVHYVGSDLESLQFNHLKHETLTAVSNLDFSASVNLLHLSIDGAVYFDENTEVLAVSPRLLALLSNVARHTRLQTIEIRVEWEFPRLPELPLPLSRLGEMFRADELASLHTISFTSPLVYHDSDKIWPSVIAMLQASIADSRVVFIL